MKALQDRWVAAAQNITTPELQTEFISLCAQHRRLDYAVRCYGALLRSHPELETFIRPHLERAAKLHSLHFVAAPDKMSRMSRRQIWTVALVAGLPVLGALAGLAAFLWLRDA